MICLGCNNQMLTQKWSDGSLSSCRDCDFHYRSDLKEWFHIFNGLVKRSTNEEMKRLMIMKAFW